MNKKYVLKEKIEGLDYEVGHVFEIDMNEMVTNFSSFSILDLHILLKLGTIEEVKGERNDWPKRGDEYFYPSFGHRTLSESYISLGDEVDERMKSHGFCFRTKEEAIACAERMLDAVRSK